MKVRKPQQESPQKPVQELRHPPYVKLQDEKVTESTVGSKIAGDIASSIVPGGVCDEQDKTDSEAVKLAHEHPQTVCLSENPRKNVQDRRIVGFKLRVEELLSSLQQQIEQVANVTDALATFEESQCVPAAKRSDIVAYRKAELVKKFESIQEVALDSFKAFTAIEGITSAAEIKPCLAWAAEYFGTCVEQQLYRWIPIVLQGKDARWPEWDMQHRLELKRTAYEVRVGLRRVRDKRIGEYLIATENRTHRSNGAMQDAVREVQCSPQPYIKGRGGRRKNYLYQAAVQAAADLFRKHGTDTSAKEMVAFMDDERVPLPKNMRPLGSWHNALADQNKENAVMVLVTKGRNQARQSASKIQPTKFPK